VLAVLDACLQHHRYQGVFPMIRTSSKKGELRGIGIALLLTLTFTPLRAAASGAIGGSHREKLSPEFRSSVLRGSVDVIVQYRRKPAAQHYARVVRAGGTTKARMEEIRGAAFHLPASALRLLADDPDVAYISPDRPVRSFLSNAAPAVNAPYAWALGYDGSGIGVAVVDSGISDHDDLKDRNGHNRIVYQANFASDGGTADAYGHGEHIAGIIGGTGKDSTCSNCFAVIRGIAPNVTLINLRALDKNGRGTDSAVINAINRAIQLKSTYNIRVLNLSVGRPIFESYKLDPLCQAVESAWKAGIVVVVAAGNYGRDNSVGEQGYGTITAPGNDPYVITVGAMRTMGTPDRADDRIASYSSKGATTIDHLVKPDLVPPANLVVSLLANGRSAAPRRPARRMGSAQVLRKHQFHCSLNAVFDTQRHQHSERRGKPAAGAAEAHA